MSRFRTIQTIVVTCFVATVAVTASPLAAYSQREEVIYAFPNYRAHQAERMILVGEVTSKQKAPDLHEQESPYIGYDTRKDQATIKVNSREGLRIGQRLYIIDKEPFHRESRNGVIIGEIEVTSILESAFYGQVITGVGNLLRVREGHFVARPLGSGNHTVAYSSKKRGDHFAWRGDEASAIRSYHEALELDGTLAEAHAALGSLYLARARDPRRALSEEPFEAVAEFRQAWRQRGHFRYESERWQFYIEYLDALHLHYSHLSRRRAREAGVVRLLDEMAQVIEAATQIDGEARDLRRRDFQLQYAILDYYGPHGSVEERRRYQHALQRAMRLATQLFSEPEAEANSHRLAARLIYQLIHLPAGEQPSEWVALRHNLYHAGLYVTLRRSRNTPAEANPSLQLRELLRYHVEFYNRYHDEERSARDPEVDRMIAELL